MPHEKLYAYELAEALALAVDSAVMNLPRRADLAEQARTASASVVLNLAEGAGEFRKREKIRFYRMARRSANECAATLRLLVRLDLLESPAGERLHGECRYLAAVISRLITAIEAR